MPEETVTIGLGFVSSGAVLLIAGWVAAAILSAMGGILHRPNLTGPGMILGGVMALATSIAYALATFPRSDGRYLVTTEAIVLLGLMGLVSGVLIAFGVRFLPLRSRALRPALTP